MNEPTNPEGSRPRSNREVQEGMARLFAPPAEDDAAAVATEEVEAEEVEDGAEAGLETEDAGEEAEQEEDEGSEGEEAETEGEETPTEFAWTLTVNGQDHQLTDEEEARSLAQRGLHYTQEMQALRDEQRKWEGERQEITAALRQKEEQYAGALRNLEQMFGHVLGEEPDWTKLYSEDRNQYADLRAQWDNLAQIRAEVGRIEAERQEQQTKEFQDYVQRESEALQAKVPEWTDPQKKQADFEMIRDYALSVGYTDQELGQVWNHRDWITLRDAARYRKAEAAGKKGAKKAADKQLEPGKSTGTVNAQTRRYKQMRKRARESGKEKDIAPLMARFIK